MLIVDDVEASRVILKEAYSADYDIIEATNGVDALDKIYFYQSNLKAVFLDVIMPQMDGFEVLKELEAKQLLWLFPIFLITTEANATVVNKAYQFGVVDVIPKPFDLLIIKRRVTNIVDLYETRRQQQQQLNQKNRLIGMQKNVYNAILEAIVSCISCRQVSSVNFSQNMVKATGVFLKYLATNYPSYNINQKEIPMLCELAGLYDIGKVAVPDEILKKPGDLVEEERAIMEEHCNLGSDIFKSIKEIKGTDLLKHACAICESHHERFDGSGYPNGLCGNDIAIEAQVVGILDAYTALLSERTYRKAFDHETAKLMIINGECGCFGPDIIDTFKKNIDEIYKTIYNNCNYF